MTPAKLMTVATLILAFSGCSSPSVTTPTQTVTFTPQPTPVHTPQLNESLATASASVGRIRTSHCEGLPDAGTGFVVQQGLILTAAHVAESASSMTITFPGGSPQRLQLLYADPSQDIALLRVPDPPPGQLGVSNGSPHAGDAVGVLGYPLGMDAIHVNSGIISATGDSALINGEPISNLITLDAAVNAGNSGGPVINTAGEVVGLISATAVNSQTGSLAEGIHFAIPAIRLRALIDSHQGSSPLPFESCSTAQNEGPQLVLQMHTADLESQTISGTLWTHGQGINDGMYDAAWAMLTPSMQERMGGLDRWAEGLDSSYWIILEVMDVSRSGSVATVRTFLRTHQDVSAGPQGQTCSIWPITYTMKLQGDSWKIDKAARRADPAPCAS